MKKEEEEFTEEQAEKWRKQVAATRKRIFGDFVGALDPIESKMRALDRRFMRRGEKPKDFLNDLDHIGPGE